MTDLGLGDTWRLLHLSAREYRYFSPVQLSLSRIDFFLTSNSIMPDKSNTKMHPITISNHSPISFNLNIHHTTKTTTRWRFNTSLLQDNDFDTYFKREWTSFMETNDYPEISSTLIWETAKAVLRGKILILFIQEKKRTRIGKQSGTKNKNATQLSCSTSHRTNPKRTKRDQISTG